MEFKNILIKYPHLIKTLPSELIVLLFDKLDFYTNHPACLQQIGKLENFCQQACKCLDFLLCDRYYDINISTLICTFIYTDFKRQISTSIICAPTKKSVFNKFKQLFD